MRWYNAKFNMDASPTDVDMPELPSTEVRQAISDLGGAKGVTKSRRPKLFLSPSSPFLLETGNKLSMPLNIMEFAEETEPRQPGETAFLPYLVRLGKQTKGGYFTWPKVRNKNGMVVFFPNLEEKLPILQGRGAILMRVAWVKEGTAGKKGCAALEFIQPGR